MTSSTTKSSALSPLVNGKIVVWYSPQEVEQIIPVTKRLPAQQHVTVFSDGRVAVAKDAKKISGKYYWYDKPNYQGNISTLCTQSNDAGYYYSKFSILDSDERYVLLVE